MGIFSKIKGELALLSVHQKKFVLFSMLVGFCIACEYGVTRPASSAIFLTHFSSASYPLVWLATVPLNLFIILIYNRLLSKIGSKRVFILFTLLAIGMNTCTGIVQKIFPGWIFFHYAWKDVYILLMFKQLWSLIHGSLHAKEAKYLYGIIFGAGTLGSIFGSLIPGFFAKMIGSETLFFMTAPIYGVLLICYLKAHFQTTFLPAYNPSQENFSKKSFSLFKKNRFLISVLLLVILMQASVALMEYRFNAHLELHILGKDLRTEYVARLGTIMSSLSAVFQFVGGFLMIHALGVRGSHLFIPVILLGNALLIWIFPVFGVVAFSYVFLKSVDFSLFGIVRELLYLPLQLDEKYKAKAIIDVFAYRTSKALISLGILLLQAFAGSSLFPALSYLSIAIFSIWIFVVLFLLKKTYPTLLKI